MSKILLVGATGYVGGTFLTDLLSSKDATLGHLTVDLLVRSVVAADKLVATYGSRVRIVPWRDGLSDLAFIRDTAAKYDVVLNIGTGFNPSSSKAFVEGLARRVGDVKTEHVPWVVGIAGCTNYSDCPLTKGPLPKRVWSDETEEDRRACFEAMKEMEEEDSYLQRTTELGVLETAGKNGVQAVSVNVPCIYGEGKGLFNRQGIVVPLKFCADVLEHGHGFSLHDDANFDLVHVEDLAALFIVILRTILERKDRGVDSIPSGEHGIVFAGNGTCLMKDIMALNLKVAFERDVLPREGTPKEKEIRKAELQDIADEMTAGMADIAERGWGGSKVSKAVVARKQLGWEPQHGKESWEKDFLDEMQAFREGRRNLNWASVVGG